ncbi:hypothetical protein GW17_00041145 [Ensete ventricosum]|nr:hypothetical protein GW17_00041145 [Ensete ventricosum]
MFLNSAHDIMIDVNSDNSSMLLYVLRLAFLFMAAIYPFDCKSKLLSPILAFASTSCEVVAFFFKKCISAGLLCLESGEK